MGRREMMKMREVRPFQKNGFHPKDSNQDENLLSQQGGIPRPTKGRYKQEEEGRRQKPNRRTNLSNDLGKTENQIKRLDLVIRDLYKPK
ncbi:hypothetical protein JTB14_014505 [Gonioctena quinquepunctata]|nr:hypothetical protein JTB14_014505 [Gonioctena quinquepunctata]